MWYSVETLNCHKFIESRFERILSTHRHMKLYIYIYICKTVTQQNHIRKQIYVLKFCRSLDENWRLAE